MKQAGRISVAVGICQNLEMYLYEFQKYLSRNRNCSKVHWSKQVRCRRLATGRAGRSLLGKYLYLSKF